MKSPAVQQELRELVSRDAVRWTKPEQFHLTLRFLGEVPVERVAALQEAINVDLQASRLCVCVRKASASSRMPGHRASFGPASTTAKGVWWICKKRLKRRSSHIRMRRGQNRFAGHVTIGRVKFLKRPEIEKLAAHAQAVKDRLFGEWTAREVELIRSDLLPAGASHTLLAAFRLKM